MKKIIFWLCIFFSICLIQAQTLEINNLARKINEPSGLNPIYALDDPSNFKDGEPIQEVAQYFDSVKQFLKTLQPITGNKKYEYLLGEWAINSGITKKVDPLKLFDISEKFSIETINGFYTICATPPVTLYEDMDGDIYYQTYWRGILKKIKYENSKIYIYHLVNDFWELDEYHDEGRYYYIKK